MPPDNEDCENEQPSGSLPANERTDGGGKHVLRELEEEGDESTYPRRTFLKGSGALAASAGLANGTAIAAENGLAGDVPEEPEDGQVRHFEVHAIEVDLVYNRFGLHQPNAAILVLKEDLKEAKRLSGKVPCANSVVLQDEQEEAFCEDIPKKLRADGDTRVLQPLSLRANFGDVIEVEFHNDLDRRASIHQTALPYEVRESDGMNVGENPDTTVAPGDSITYRWDARRLGTHFFLDGANQAYDSADEPPQKANLTARGLFGSVSVLPKGTTWTDPYTGKETQGRVQADVHVPEDVPEEAVDRGFVPGLSYRQILLHYHTPEGIVTRDGDQLTFPDSDEPQMVHAINYRADPTGNRIPPLDDPIEREAFYNSWVHGDPGGGDNAYPMYLGDPVKTVSVGASIEENHVHHLHGHRWKETPPDERSDTIDSQTLGLGAVYDEPFTTAFGTADGSIEDLETVRPDMTFEEAFRTGAGGAHGSPGDYLFHCHLFPHYGEGMWGLVRVLDKEREGLQKLPDNDPPIPADSDVEGFPEFIPGEFGEAPPYPPYGAAGLDDFRDPEPDEEDALTRNGDDILPGAPYTDPCEPDIEGFEPDVQIEGMKRDYTIVALPADVVYNDDGHHDPNGIVYVLEKYREVDPDTGKVLVDEDVNDVELIKEGKLNPEPLVVRANVGDCVDVTFKNEVTDENLAAIPADRFPEGDDDALPESVPVEEGGKSTHIHFVSYDVLGSDSLATGFNYRQDAQPGERNFFRWFADEEGTIFFHDHITGIEDVMHGSFCSLVVEPPNSEWFDPYSGDPVRSGTQAIIENPDGEDFREFALAYHDFAQLVDRDGELVNDDAEHNENAGVMGINYRNTPFHIRDDCDPAYVFSSFVHGDPSTPLLETYEGDPVRIRLWMGAYEEQHTFHVNGRHFESEGNHPEESTSQILGTSEAFTLDLNPEGDGMEGADMDAFTELGNPAGLPVRDHLYGSPIIDDLWEGMWGIHRRFGAATDHLQPLPDRGLPDEEITEEELKEMGHPAPFADFDWTEFGHRARLLYDDDDDREFPPDKDERQNDEITGDPPERAPDPGDPCPDDAPVRTFDVSAVDAEIEYNDHGDRDEFGVVYTLDEHADDVRDGDSPVPLTLWANLGDCIEVNFTNRVDPDEFEDHAHPEMRTEHPWDRSKRMSMHATHLEYDVLGSDGATVGFNWDQTVAPGETITYRWFVDEETPSSIFWDYADVRSTRHHGAYGNVIATPPEAELVDPRTAEPTPQGLSTEAMVKTPDGPDQRLVNLLFADAQFILNEDDPDDCVVPPGHDEEVDPDDPCNQLGDPEDHGYMAINYRAEPFVRRFEEDDDQYQVYDSDVHGDPATPLPRALLGDPVSLVVGQGADKARGISFHLAAHQWPRFEDVDASPEIGVDDRHIVGRSDERDLLDDAGGLAESVGDHIYQEMKQRRRLEAGAWGIFRVREDPEDFRTPVQPLPDRATGIPVDERIGWVTARGDLTGDGTKDLVVLVPDSVRGSEDASALYVFLGPVDEKSITDLTGADVEVVGTLHDDEHEHGTATVRLSDDLGIDDLDTLLGLVTDATVAVGNCDSRRKSENPLSKLEFDAGEKRSGDVDVTLARGGDGESRKGDRSEEVAIDVTAADVDEDGSLELAIDLEDGPRVVVDGCESLFG
ncbi:multicopper oxidase domain-containing protein [Halorarum salinum]|uniref:Multicopper oxidase domain-containing protein n=1 Tax=Halorarum salinum TaxID=2743089 RepID=A0A7D5QF97_9EURY|nr:multicopper oxidase domain-containing protein [Halobaculum salinum]QLG60504.1 multicopper oxidase domain-containing protein [Halobaculum salinum]